MSFDLTDSLLKAYATNHRINIYLIKNVPDEAWREKFAKKGRDVASIVAHMHNVRLMWLKSAGKTAILPAKLDGDASTKDDAIQAHQQSWQAVDHVLRDAFASDGRVKGFKPDAGSFAAYLLAHDAHHRGQISMLARLLGHPLSQSAMFGLWEWGTR